MHFAGKRPPEKQTRLRKNREAWEAFSHIAQNESIRFVVPAQQIAPHDPYGAIIINIAQKIKGFFEKIVLTAQKTFCIIKKREKRTEA